MEFTKSECLAFFNSFLDFAQCKWVNDREAERSASRKPFQLQAALAAGLRIPKTLITNDPAQVLAFRDECEGQIAFKPLSGVSSRALDYSKEAADLFAGQFSLEPAIKESSTESTIPLIFTQILDDSKIPYLSNLAASPAIFQEYVEKSSELRVTIVGSQVFAARIYSQEANITKTDFRRFSLPGNPKIRHELCKLPDELVRRLLQLMNALNLVFGCIDMIETPEGDYVFLEVNPSGQWGWIEDYTGAPISQALAGMLGNF
jgi:glutathione synthase/RimK-type ligase-like ATP-grasp enzyme